MKKRKSENADDTKQIADGTKQIADDTKQIADDTKQNYGMKTYGICGSPWIPILSAKWQTCPEWDLKYLKQVEIGETKNGPHPGA
ncbi:hypothetical protein T10_4625 [Trichinella papuae]|uniref:Uncharacterized protein n=1 Tax=Trichinella papuae TaxID=268474 RepID=A0A0V1MAB5_9BILA|nr:hypothetical protein T10_4625 [Trichinella papuae]